MSEKPVTVITPARPWRLPDLRELWSYRELFLALGARDIKVRYRQTVLGVAWAVIQPLATMLLFTLIFGRFAKVPSDGFPYPVFVYAGLLPWILFSSTTTAAAGSIVGSASFITRVWFPRILIPPAAVASPLVDFLISSTILLGLMLLYDVPFGLGLLSVPLLTLLLIVLAMSVGTALSAMIVTYRDVRFLISFLIQFWMFASPVIYPTSLVPEKWRWILELNPMTGVIEGFRSAFLGRPFDLTSLGISVGITVVLAALAISYFQNVEERFADVI